VERRPVQRQELRLVVLPVKLGQSEPVKPELTPHQALRVLDRHFAQRPWEARGEIEAALTRLWTLVIEGK
jgi:hypothetical protein